MKQFLLGFSICLLGAIVIVSVSEISNIQSRKVDPNAKFYTLVNGSQYYGTNDEANRLNKAIKERQ